MSCKESRSPVAMTQRSPARRAAAESVYERHRLLTDCLIRLGVSPETAAEDACRVEHVISAESFEKIKEYAARIPEK